MRPARFFLPGLLVLPLAGLLSACSRTTDNFAPRIFITSPNDGSTSQTRNPLVKGYVMDDMGVSRISVNGKPIKIEAGARKIARFQFQANVTGAKGEYTIDAYDNAGHDSKLTIPLLVDAQKPQIDLKAFERSGRLIRVSGVVSDNNQVSEILVDGRRLNITPGKRVEFYAQTTGIYADIEAYDAAGNKTNIRAER